MIKFNLSTAILLVILCVVGQSIAYKQVHFWSGYSPQCQNQCRIDGEPCDIGKQIICCQKQKCTSKYGLYVCQAPISNFTCTPVPQNDLIKQVLDPKLYPNLYNQS